MKMEFNKTHIAPLAEEYVSANECFDDARERLEDARKKEDADLIAHFEVELEVMRQRVDFIRAELSKLSK